MKHVLYGKCVSARPTTLCGSDQRCECGILDIVYDYDYIRTRLTKEKLAARQDHTMWRYRELLPVEDAFGGLESLYEEPRLAEQLGLKRLWVRTTARTPPPV